MIGRLAIIEREPLMQPADGQVAKFMDYISLLNL
jgi:hypothetical protein